MESSSIPKIKMEFELDSIALGAFWLPSFEVDSFNNTTFGNDSLGYDASSPEHRRKVASELLEALEESSHQNQDEPYCGWLEEPMDLEVFGQSLAEPSSATIPLEEEDYLSAPPSPLVSLPPTPIQPSSPQLYPSVDDLPVLKFEESVIAEIPAENAELLESLELLLHQIQSEETIVEEPQQPVKDDEVDMATALLDSLIKGDVEESQVFDELAEFSLALIDPTEVELILPTPSSASPQPSISSESEDQEWIPSPTPARKNRAGTAPKPPTQRKPRKKNAKVEDRKMRKKEQNKTAATRYRIKKKAELEILLEEAAVLEEHNVKLQRRHDELANEVRYLKKLMKEVFVASSGKKHR